MGWGFVRALVRPDHPEPVSVEHWRRGERAMLTVMPPLAALNVASRFLVAHDARIDLHAVDEFLAVNLTAHALLLGAAAYAFLRPRAEQVHRAATTVIVLAALGTVLPGLWLLGSLTPNLNTLFVIVTVAVVRVYYDSRLGLVALLAALVMHVGLVAVEAAGILQPDPLFIDGHRPLYGLLRVPAVSWIIAVYTMVWALSSYVAHRIRASEHALRELNTGLETRVREQVTALERAHRLRRYVAPQLADEILRSEADVTMRRERRPITVMFADIRGFTPMVERVAPDVLADVLNRYFDEVSKIAFSHGGTIDKFIGDAIMVFFGAPEATGERDQAVRCVAMGLEIQQRVRELGDEFVRLGAGAPLELRVGIGSGTATVGSFGAAHRSDYTVVGAPVNRAARLEPLAPAGSVLVDEETHTLVDGAFDSEPYGEVTLKGFARPARAFRVVAPAPSGTRMKSTPPPSIRSTASSRR